MTKHKTMPPACFLSTVKKIVDQGTENVFFGDHAQERMDERDISNTQVIDCLRRGSVIEGPAKNVRGSWEAKLHLTYSAGQAVNVVVILDPNNDQTFDYVRIKTVM